MQGKLAHLMVGLVLVAVAAVLLRRQQLKMALMGQHRL
jgi:uncharacterized membrane protein YjdF